MEQELTQYYDKNGRCVCVGDWIRFLFWYTCSDGLQRERYIYGRILKRRGKLIFRHKVFGTDKPQYSERRLDVLNFDSTMDWEIVDDICHYGGYMPAQD